MTGRESKVRDCEDTGGICWRDTSVKEQILFVVTASGPEGIPSGRIPSSEVCNLSVVQVCAM